jgi:hypothetical protein
MDELQKFPRSRTGIPSLVLAVIKIATRHALKVIHVRPPVIRSCSQISSVKRHAKRSWTVVTIVVPSVVIPVNAQNDAAGPQPSRFPCVTLLYTSLHSANSYRKPGEEELVEIVGLQGGEVE